MFNNRQVQGLRGVRRRDLAPERSPEPDDRRALHARRAGVQLVQPAAHGHPARQDAGGAADLSACFDVRRRAADRSVAARCQQDQRNIEFNTLASTFAPLVVNNSWNDTSPRVVLDYKLSPDTDDLRFGRPRATRPAATTACCRLALRAGNVWNYEGGLKSYLPDYHLLLNASVYYYKYSNLQSLSLVSNGNGTCRCTSSRSATRKPRVSISRRTGRPPQGLRLNFVAAYIDSEYKKYIASDGADLSGQPTGEPKWSMAGRPGLRLAQRGGRRPGLHPAACVPRKGTLQQRFATCRALRRRSRRSRSVPRRTAPTCAWAGRRRTRHGASPCSATICSTSAT